MPSVFTVASIEGGPIVSRWEVRKNGKLFLTVEVMLRGPGTVRVAILPPTRNVPDGDFVWMDRDEGHAAFYAATLNYDVRAARDRSIPAVSVEDWREIENALDAERALDVA